MGCSLETTDPARTAGRVNEYDEKSQRKPKTTGVSVVSRSISLRPPNIVSYRRVQIFLRFGARAHRDKEWVVWYCFRAHVTCYLYLYSPQTLTHLEHRWQAGDLARELRERGVS